MKVDRKVELHTGSTDNIGAEVTVTFDDSPGVSRYCTPENLRDGRSYTVREAGGPTGTYTTKPDPEKVKGKPGNGNWQQAEPYRFTAGEQERPGHRRGVLHRPAPPARYCSPARRRPGPRH